MYKKKKIIIIIMCIMILLMTVGYAAFSTGLKINGTANIASSWNVYFESITTKSIAGGVTNKETPKVENLTATMNIDFTAPGDKIVYEVVLKNGGTLDAVVNGITAEKGGTPQIDCVVEGIKKGDKITKGQSKKITITLEFDEEAEIMPNLKEGFIKVEIECVQALNNVTSENLVVYQPMLRVNTTTSGSTVAFLNGPIKREQIESITFTNTKTVPSGVIGSWDVSADGKKGVMAWYVDSDGDKLYEVTIGQDGGVVANPDSSKLFYYCINVEKIDLTYFDTSLATNMLSTFSHLNKITSLNLTGLDTSKVTNMKNLFYDCPLLESLDLSNFNTAKVTNMEMMFNECASFVSLNVDNFVTTNVTNMAYMFGGCVSLEVLDLSNFYTPNLTSMSGLVYKCMSLKELNISNFDTSKTTAMGSVFEGCSNLNTLYFNNATFGSVTNYGAMFKAVYNKMTITVKSETEKAWILDKLPTANVVLA